MNYHTEIAEPLIGAGLVSAESIQGCTVGEIEELVTVQHVQHLPQAYRDFLEFSGRDPYWLSRGGEWDFEWLLEAKDVAREIVEVDYAESFAQFDDTFIFQTHQGYMFSFFRAEDLTAQDPHFWIYTGGRPLRKSINTFTEWIRMLAATLPQNIELRNQFHRRTE